MLKKMSDSIEIIRSVNPELQRSEELGMSSADSLTSKNSEESSNSLENVLSNSQQYEVMYLGKLRLSQKRGLPSFIDETVDNWKKEQKLEQRNSADLNRRAVPTLAVDNRINVDENKENISLNTNYKLRTCAEEHVTNAALANITNQFTDCLDQSTYQNKNHLHLPSNHSLITNTQSLDESSRESILSDLKEVKQQPEESADKQKFQDTKMNTIDHILTDNLNDLNDIKRSSSAKCQSSHNSKLNTVNRLQMRNGGARLRSASGDTRMSKQVILKTINFHCIKFSIYFYWSKFFFIYLQVSLPLYGRSRTGSGGSSDFNKRYSNSILQLRAQNRTMLFLICRFEICILSLDNQQILLKKSFNNVTHCSQGVSNADHFAFICKEEQKSLPIIYSNCKKLDDSNNYLNNTCSNSSSSSCLDNIEFDKQQSSSYRNSSSNLSSLAKSSNNRLSSNDLTNEQQDNTHHYVGYIFRGENEKLVNEIMYSLKQAFHNAHQAIQQSKTKTNVFCSDCPLKRFNELCIQLHDVSVEKSQCIILNKIGELLPNEQKEIMNGYEG